MLDYFEPHTVSYSLDSPVSAILSSKEIDAALFEVETLLRRGRSNISSLVQGTPHYQRILSGTVSELIAFLRSFREKESCLFAHEFTTRVSFALRGRVITIFPESCAKQEGYAGCGHPEYNGLILALIVGDLLFDKKYPNASKVTHTRERLFADLISWDTTAFIDYREDDRPVDERLFSLLRQNQDRLSKESVYQCQIMAVALEEVYR